MKVVPRFTPGRGQTLEEISKVLSPMRKWAGRSIYIFFTVLQLVYEVNDVVFGCI